MKENASTENSDFVCLSSYSQAKCMSQSFDLANGFAAEEYTEVLQTDCCTGKVIEDHCQEGNMVTNGGLLKLPNLWLNDVQQMDLGFARLQPDFFHPIGIEIQSHQTDLAI